MKILLYMNLSNVKCKSFSVALVLHFTFLSAQTPTIDSLKQVIATAKEDTTRINALNALGWELRRQNPDTSILLGKQALELATVIASEAFSAKRSNLYLAARGAVANSHSNLGIYYWLKSDYPLSLSHHFKALTIRKELQNLQGIAASLGNIGIVYYEQGDYPAALKYYFEALKIDKEPGDKRTQANIYNRLGEIMRLTNNYSDAFKYHKRALHIYQKLNSAAGAAYTYNDIALVHEMTHAYDSALSFHYQSLMIKESLDDKQGTADSYSNLGTIYKKLGNYQKAIELQKKTLIMDLKSKNNKNIAITYNNMGALYLESGNVDTAAAYLGKALSIAKQINAKDIIKYSYLQLSYLSEKLENYQTAYLHFKKYSNLKDTLFNEEKAKELGRLEQQHEYEMAEIARSQREKEEKIKEEEKINRRNLLQYSAILICIFLFFGLILLMGKFNVSHWVVELSVFMLFLLIFEFTLVLLDPTIDAWTGGAPAYKLLLNALLAGLIFPVHGLCERLLKKKIMERR